MRFCSLTKVSELSCSRDLLSPRKKRRFFFSPSFSHGLSLHSAISLTKQTTLVIFFSLLFHCSVCVCAVQKAEQIPILVSAKMPLSEMMMNQHRFCHLVLPPIAFAINWHQNVTKIISIGDRLLNNQSYAMQLPFLISRLRTYVGKIGQVICNIRYCVCCAMRIL